MVDYPMVESLVMVFCFPFMILVTFLGYKINPSLPTHTDIYTQNYKQGVILVSVNFLCDTFNVNV